MDFKLCFLSMSLGWSGAWGGSCPHSCTNQGAQLLELPRKLRVEEKGRQLKTFENPSPTVTLPMKNRRSLGVK